MNTNIILKNDRMRQKGR